ncbi:DUF3159 domain-containing protein [Streptacidiphilus neutrinimicus]|uniref:DUF3159 domain-containing protein n=1 Tax=Streptacidiphilus neutrinimicus TaxID=105420 RepID=UPI0005A9CDEE|nr:DUF3159 domain-containing protein [Streptacidiphilus neutrinimicus]
MSHRAASAEAAADTSLIDAFGGIRGMVDMTVPGLVFVVLYTITKSVGISSWSAVGVTLLLVVWRLLRKETLKHAFGGVLGVAIGAFIAMESGKPQNFYLPSMIYGLVLMVVYAVSALVRWPLLGVMLGPVLGENMTWRTQNPGRLAAYTKATWVWVALFALRAAILFPLYWAGQITWLGVAKIGLGVPPWLVAIYLSWLILSKAPAPIKVTSDEDPEATDAPEPQAGRTTDDAFSER